MLGVKHGERVVVDEAGEIKRLVRERELLNEAMRQDRQRLAHPETTWSERKAINNHISANVDRLLAAARRLYELGVQDVDQA